MAAQVDAAADAAIRVEAFRQVERLVRIHGGYVPVSELRRKSRHGDWEYAYIQNQQGIYRPSDIRHVLSVVSSPKASNVWYRDQGRLLDGFFNQGNDVGHDMMWYKTVTGIGTVQIRQDQSLFEVMAHGVPLLYFCASLYTCPSLCPKPSSRSPSPMI